jgi:hypothetical protein
MGDNDQSVMSRRVSGYLLNIYVGYKKQKNGTNHDGLIQIS